MESALVTSSTSSQWPTSRGGSGVGPRGSGSTSTSFQTGSSVFFLQADTALRCVPGTVNVTRGSDEPPFERRFLSLMARPVAWNRPMRSSLGSLPACSAASSSSNLRAKDG